MTTNMPDPKTPGTPSKASPKVWPAGTSDGLRESVRAIALGTLLSLVAIGLGGALVVREYRNMNAGLWAAEARIGAASRLIAGPAGAMLPTEAVIHGHELFADACAACHKADGTGVPGLGKSLVDSDFVASLSDEELRAFVIAGRAADSPENTTRVPMPPRGGRDDLSDEDLLDIVTYMRGLQDPRRMPELPELAAAPEPEPAVVVSGDIDPELAAWIASGSKLYAQSCASCHGKDAKGVKGLGLTLVDSKFCRELDDEELLDFIMVGRGPADPANTTGVGMPAKGGNPALSEDDILDIITYLRSLQDPAMLSSK